MAKPVLASEREAREFNEVLSTFAYLSQQSEELPDPPPHWEMEYIWFPNQPPTGKLNTFDFPPTPPLGNGIHLISHPPPTGK